MKERSFRVAFMACYYPNMNILSCLSVIHATGHNPIAHHGIL